MAIKVTPQDLDDMASQLENYAGNVETLASGLDGAVNAALDAWEGAAKNDYQAKYQEFKPTLGTELPQFIREMAANARSRAQAYRDADSV